VLPDLLAVRLEPSSVLVLVLVLVLSGPKPSRQKQRLPPSTQAREARCCRAGRSVRKSKYWSRKRFLA